MSLPERVLQGLSPLACQGEEFWRRTGLCFLLLYPQYFVQLLGHSKGSINVYAINLWTNRFIVFTYMWQVGADHLHLAYFFPVSMTRRSCSAEPFLIRAVASGLQGQALTLSLEVVVLSFFLPLWLGWDVVSFAGASEVEHTCLISLFVHSIIPGLPLKFPVYLGQAQVCGWGLSWGHIKPYRCLPSSSV